MLPCLPSAANTLSMADHSSNPLLCAILQKQEQFLKPARRVVAEKCQSGKDGQGITRIMLPIINRETISLPPFFPVGSHSWFNDRTPLSNSETQKSPGAKSHSCTISSCCFTMQSRFATFKSTKPTVSSQLLLILWTACL